MKAKISFLKKTTVTSIVFGDNEEHLSEVEEKFSAAHTLTGNLTKRLDDGVMSAIIETATRTYSVPLSAVTITKA